MSEQIIDIPKSKHVIEEITLPCGYVDESNNLIKNVEIREITGNEEDLLASEKIRPGIKSNRLLSSCINRIGNIVDKKKIEEIVQELTAMDRYFILLRLRMLSLGSIFKFEMACPSCNDKKIRNVDLNQVAFIPSEDVTKKIFTGVLPKTGMPYKWHVLIGKLESKAESIQNPQENLMTAMIVQRLIELNGRPATITDIKNLPLVDRNYLRAEFSKNEGKIDDVIEIECPNCGAEFSTSLDFGNREFFFPSLT